MSRVFTSAVVAATLVLGLAACATSPAAKTADPVTTAVSTPSATPSKAVLTPASFMKDTAAALAKAGSYAFASTTTTSGMTITSAGSVADSTPTHLAMELTVVSGSSGTVKMRLVDGHAYMDGTIAGAAGKWIDLADAAEPSLSGLAGQAASSADPSGFLEKVSKDAMQITAGEQSTVDGIAVTAYNVAVDFQVLAKASGMAITQAQIDQVTAAGGSSVGVVYLVDKDSRPVKVTVAMGDFMTQKTTYSGFGTQAPVTAPEPATVILASTLGI
jgi:hypothetical protein